MKKVSFLLLAFILTLMFCASCSAKIIRSNDSRFAFETSDNWYYTRVGGGDSITDEVLTVARDKDTVVTLKRSNVYFKYKTFRDFSSAEKSQFRDNAIRQTTNNMQRLGYDARVIGANIFDGAIAISYNLFKGGQRFHMMESFSMKDYILYSLSFTSNEYTDTEAGHVFMSLTVDGMPFSQWLK